MSKPGRQIFAADVEEVEDGADVATVTATVSTPDITRGGEVVLPTAFEARLASYLANPMFMWGHAWHGGPESILGRAASVKATSKGLRVKLEYHLRVGGEPRPLAQEVFRLVKSGLLKAFSIGFWPHHYVTRYSADEVLATLPKWARQALESGEAWAIHTDVELMEISQVLIPANREAVLQAHAVGLCSATFTRLAMHELGHAPAVTYRPAPAPAPTAPTVNDVLGYLLAPAPTADEILANLLNQAAQEHAAQQRAVNAVLGCLLR